MTRLSASELLTSIDFGSDVAERDAGLTRYFFRSSAYDDFVNDEIDLVLGPKGSGKSALFRIVADPDFAIDELASVDILPAFQLSGALPIARVAESVGLEKDFEFRRAWRTFYTAMVGNHLCDTYGHLDSVAAIDEQLRQLGLRAQPERTDVWKVLISGTRISLGTTDADRAEFQETTLDRLLEACVDCLDALGRQAWVVFDRLDESFNVAPEVESAALRSLLQAARDVNSLGWPVRVKLFARNDIVRRAADDRALRNMTHLRPQTLEWLPRDLDALICERLLDNEKFRRAFGCSRDDAFDRNRRSEVLGYLVPPGAPTQLPAFGLKPRSAAAWLLSVTQDGSGKSNPRTLISLLRFARTEQLRLLRTREVATTYPPLISELALYRGYVKVSQTQLENTISAENPELRMIIDRLDGCPPEFASEAAFGEFVQLSGDELRSAQESLILTGVLRRIRGGRLAPAYIYRAALRVTGPR